MIHRRAAALVLLPMLAGCSGAAGAESPMIVHGLTVERIAADHEVVLADGLIVAGDRRLAEALADGGAGIAGIVLLERMPPVLVVTYADGEIRRYRSRLAAP